MLEGVRRLGPVIAVEGLSRAGKTEAVAHTVRVLQNYDPHVQAAFELASPPGRVLDELFRSRQKMSPQLKALLFAADRDWLLGKLVTGPSRYAVTVFDRYVYSNIVYRSEEGLDTPWLEALEKHCPAADLGILVDIDPETSLARSVAAGSPTPYSRSFLAGVAERYRTLADNLGFITINGMDDIETVKASVASAVQQYIDTQLRT